MKTLITLSILFSGAQANAHGSLEIIECHNKDNSIVVRGEAMNKQNVFKFAAIKSGKQVWEQKNIQLALTDTVEKKQLIENIKFKTNQGDAHLKIEEIHTREIRNGSGKVNFAKLGITQDLNCYAVY